MTKDEVAKEIEKGLQERGRTFVLSWIEGEMAVAGNLTAEDREWLQEMWDRTDEADKEGD